MISGNPTTQFITITLDEATGRIGSVSIGDWRREGYETNPTITFKVVVEQEQY